MPKLPAMVYHAVKITSECEAQPRHVSLALHDALEAVFVTLSTPPSPEPEDDGIELML
jgi:hypothetical protein